jgi:hypothetical protein
MIRALFFLLPVKDQTSLSFLMEAMRRLMTQALHKEPLEFTTRSTDTITLKKILVKKE